LIARRCATADAVAAWAKDMHDGQHGRHGQSGQSGVQKPSTPSPKSTPSTPSTPSAYAEISANGALALIAVACSLLDRQLAAQAAAFEKNGGFTERLYHVRRQRRNPA
jgi:four helix bundle suffix protein